MKCRMQMLADDARISKRRHLGNSATLRVLPRQLDDDRPLACDRVLEKLAGLNRTQVGRS